MKECMLSIIVPVYNGEDFISNAIDKLLEVELKKEIIVIDDGSTDSTKKILDSYKNEIKVIELSKNEGVSNARNVGIDNAKGKYLTFLDIDDEFEINMYPEMISKLEIEKNDICICNYNEFQEQDERKYIKSKYKYQNIDKEQILKLYLIDKISPAIWDKVYLTSFIKNIKFNTSLSIGEDILFCLDIFLKTKKVSFIDEYYYHYYQQQKSVMHTISQKLLEFNRIIEFINKEDYQMLESQYKEELEFFRLEMATRGIHSITTLANKENKKQAYQYIKYYYNHKNLIDIAKNRYFSKFVRLEMLILNIFGIKIHLMLAPQYTKIRNMVRK